MATHVRRWVCVKADGNYSGLWDVPHEPEKDWFRRAWWVMRSMVAVWWLLADECPQVRNGDAVMSYGVDPTRFTIDHRAVALRVLVAQCTCCPEDLGGDMADTVLGEDYAEAYPPADVATGA